MFFIKYILLYHCNLKVNYFYFIFKYSWRWQVKDDSYKLFESILISGGFLFEGCFEGGGEVYSGLIGKTYYYPEDIGKLFGDILF